MHAVGRSFLAMTDGANSMAGAEASKLLVSEALFTAQAGPQRRVCALADAHKK